ncbi:MAG TPA: enoyl-CoA hydratase-related protein [Dehalococcoidia bacterium]|nr:enoyl-CoA hydratase-related protein [Dehalococcoidia bacterium]
MSTVKYEVRDRTAYVTLDRPEALNAINTALRDDLRATWHRFRADDAAWVAILTGAGDRAFCAGADIKEMRAGQGREGDPFWLPDDQDRSLESGFPLYKPVIAAINGHCLGGGMTLAAGCDIRVASTKATFGFPEVAVGLPTVMGAVWLAKTMPLGRGLELLLTGRRFSADEMSRAGFLEYVVEPGQEVAKAEEIARQINANAPLAVRVTKEVFKRSLEMPMGDAFRFGEAMRRVVRTTEDAQEGPRAFTEKRPPQYQGR